MHVYMPREAAGLGHQARPNRHACLVPADHPPIGYTLRALALGRATSFLGWPPVVRRMQSHFLHFGGQKWRFGPGPPEDARRLRLTRSGAAV